MNYNEKDDEVEEEEQRESQYPTEQAFRARYTELISEGLDKTTPAAQTIEWLQSSGTAASLVTDSGDGGGKNMKNSGECADGSEKGGLEGRGGNENLRVEFASGASECTESAMVLDEGQLIAAADMKESSIFQPRARMDDGVSELTRNAPSVGEDMDMQQEDEKEVSNFEAEKLDNFQTEKSTPDLTFPGFEILSVSGLSALVSDATANGNYVPIVHRVGQVFSNPTALKNGFLLDPDKPRIDLEKAGAIFSILEDTGDARVCRSLQNALVFLSFQVQHESNTLCRVVAILVALEYQPFEYDPDLVRTVSALFNGISSCPKDGRDLVLKIFRESSYDYLNRMLATVQMFITLKISLGRDVADYVYVKEGVVMLDMLYQVFKEKRFCDYSEFYNSAVNELAIERDSFLKEDINEWYLVHEKELGNVTWNGKGERSDTFRDHSYIFDSASKARILLMESQVKAFAQYLHDLRERRPSDGVLGFSCRSSPYFVLRVRRQNIVSDVLDIVHETDPNELRKTLKVKFIGEEGVDEGGPKKEFFLLAVRKLLDPQYGMFVSDENSRLTWFNADTFESKVKFQLVGIILGLALYNGVILDLPLPSALYKKLLDYSLDLSDFKAFNPRVGASLEFLLAFEGNVKEEMSLSFVATYEAFGETKTVPLKIGGEDIEVTNENREEYVALYVDWALNKHTKEMFAAFKKGFDLVCKNSFVTEFHPDELELLLCGNENMDFKALEKSAIYADGYSSTSPIIADFWRIVHELSDDKKKALLMFCTGSDRVPIRGLSALKLTISRNGPDSDLLPTANTCFNHLLLPEYLSADKLEEKLLLAITHCTGFGSI